MNPCLKLITPHRHGVAFLALLACTATLQSATVAPDVLDIGSRRQVFIDRRFLDRAQGVELTVHPPTKTGEETIKADQPWEKGIDVYNSVLEVNGTYHLWYQSGNATCYATSRDGIHWEKPNLGLAEFNGSRSNNIVVGHGAAGVAAAGEGGMVFLDPQAPPAERFRLTMKEFDPPFLDVFSSPDGIHWKPTHRNVIKFTSFNGKQQHLDSQNVIFWDDRISKYVAYMRRNDRPKGPRLRTIARSESPVLGGFDEAQVAPVVLAHDDLDAKLGIHDLVDYYTSGAIKYPGAQDAYYMFPTAYLHYVAGEFSEFPKQAPANAGPLHTQFAASRDGIHWERYGRRPFIPLGPKGSFDSKGARILYGIVPSVDGQQFYLYYLGTDQLHGWGRDDRNNRLLTGAGLQPEKSASIISRLVLRRDGFVSARADYAGGEFTTGLLRFAGKELVLNVDTSATGLLRCELLDDAGKPVPGFSLAESDVVHTTNETERRVSWRGNHDLGALAGKPVKLRFVFRDSDLYSFQFR